MGIVEEVDSMKKQGRSENEITSTLRQRGATEQSISGAISQSKIKSAVQGETYQQQESTHEDEMASNAQTQEYSEMSPSLMSTTSPLQENTQQNPQEAPQEAAQEQTPAAYPEYQSYSQPQEQYSSQGYSSGISSDIITEIADQAVSEKLTPILNAMDKILDMKSNMDSQIKYMDERLKRIEKIIDRLQLSVLQRVGEYVSNVEDIKQEMQETQKTFKALVDKKG